MIIFVSLFLHDPPEWNELRTQQSMTSDPCICDVSILNIYDRLWKLNSKKATGSDGIPVRFFERMCCSYCITNKSSPQFLTGKQTNSVAMETWPHHSRSTLLMTYVRYLFYRSSLRSLRASSSPRSKLNWSDLTVAIN